MAQKSLSGLRCEGAALLAGSFVVLAQDSSNDKNEQGTSLPAAEVMPRVGEKEWISNLAGKETKVRILVSGADMGAKEVDKLIKLLEAQRAVLEDEDA